MRSKFLVGGTVVVLIAVPIALIRYSYVTCVEMSCLGPFFNKFIYGNTVVTVVAIGSGLVLGAILATIGRMAATRRSHHTS